MATGQPSILEESARGQVEPAAAGAVGFVGLGVMGEPMCLNLARKSGRSVVSYDPMVASTQRLAESGVEPTESVAAVAERAEVIFLALPSGRQVEDVIRGDGGILDLLRPGMVVVDLGTSPLQLTRELAALVAERGATFVDAPVARTRAAAEQGELSIMVGGDEETLARIRPLLECMASDITYCGGTGSGQVVKILNNMVLFATGAALAEALALGRRAGVDGKVLFDALSRGSADSFALRNHGLKAILPNEFPSRSFSTIYARKDLSYALEIGKFFSLAMPSAENIERLFNAAIDAGYGEKYWPVVARIIDREPLDL